MVGSILILVTNEQDAMVGLILILVTNEQDAMVGSMLVTNEEDAMVRSERIGCYGRFNLDIGDE